MIYRYHDIWYSSLISLKWYTDILHFYLLKYILILFWLSSGILMTVRDVFVGTADDAGKSCDRRWWWSISVSRYSNDVSVPIWYVYVPWYRYLFCLQRIRYSDDGNKCYDGYRLTILTKWPGMAYSVPSSYYSAWWRVLLKSETYSVLLKCISTTIWPDGLLFRRNRVLLFSAMTSLSSTAFCNVYSRDNLSLLLPSSVSMVWPVTLFWWWLFIWYIVLWCYYSTWSVIPLLFVDGNLRQTCGILCVLYRSLWLKAISLLFFRSVNDCRLNVAYRRMYWLQYRRKWHSVMKPAVSAWLYVASFSEL